MDGKTLKALKQSIKKWERNAVAETPEDTMVGSDSCPLCKLFWKRRCEGCPVRDRTEETYCDGSPYDDAEFASVRWGSAPEDENLRNAAHAAAREEVAFLRSLLPEEEATP